MLKIHSRINAKEERGFLAQQHGFARRDVTATRKNLNKQSSSGVYLQLAARFLHPNPVCRGRADSVRNGGVSGIGKKGTELSLCAVLTDEHFYGLQSPTTQAAAS